MTAFTCQRDTRVSYLGMTPNAENTRRIELGDRVINAETAESQNSGFAIIYRCNAARLARSSS